MDSTQWMAERLAKVESLTARFRGAKYLSALGLCLTRVLEVQFAMVTQRLPGAVSRGRAVVFADAQNMRAPFVYETATHPCYTVLGGEAVAVPCNASELYPGADEIDAYVGQPLYGVSGDVIGLLAIEHTHRITREAEISQLLLCLSGRVAAEMESLGMTADAQAQESPILRAPG